MKEKSKLSIKTKRLLFFMLLFYRLRGEGEGWSVEGGCNRILTLGEPRLFADIVSASSVNRETSTFRLDARNVDRMHCRCYHVIGVCFRLESNPRSPINQETRKLTSVKTKLAMPKQRNGKHNE